MKNFSIFFKYRIKSPAFPFHNFFSIIIAEKLPFFDLSQPFVVINLVLASRAVSLLVACRSVQMQEFSGCLLYRSYKLFSVIVSETFLFLAQFDEIMAFGGHGCSKGKEVKCFLSYICNMFCGPVCSFWFWLPACCSDFRYESNGIFVHGVGFFLQTNFDFLTSHF